MMIVGANWCRLQLAQMDMIIFRDKSRNLTKWFEEVNCPKSEGFFKPRSGEIKQQRVKYFEIKIEK